LSRSPHAAAAQDFAFERYKHLFGLSAIGLLILPRCRTSGRRSTARAWASRAVQFQPGELAKFGLIVFLAGYLREKARCSPRAG
jgi:cell division protein FtsW (lipid II flippase)